MSTEMGHSGALQEETAPRREQRPPGLSLGRIAGIEVHADWSLLIIFGLIAYSLGASIFPSWHPEWSVGLRWWTALLAAASFLVSVLAHELSHGLVGRMQGISVRRITLFLFGGIAHMDNRPATPQAEFLIAIVGPMTSVLIGLMSVLGGTLIAGDAFGQAAMSGDADQLLQAMHGVGPLATLLLWLGPLNVALGLFNLVPGFPLDGGRVLRSILWAITHDFAKATRWATGMGQLVAWILMGIGVLNLFSGSFAQGIWLLLIGWFLNNAARMSYEQVLARLALEDVAVSRVMRTQVERVPATMSIEALVADHLLASDQHAFPVETRDGTLLGLVSADDVRKVARADWATTSVASVMTRAASLSSLPPDAPAQDAFEELLRRDVEQLPVLEGQHLLGLVRRRDLLRWVALQRPHALA